MSQAQSSAPFPVHELSPPPKADTLEGWASALPELGFELLFQTTYVPVEERWKKIAGQASSQGRQNNPASPPCATQEFKWWRHPAGVLATSRRTIPSSDDPGKSPAHQVTLHATLSRGYAQPQQLAGFYLPDGRPAQALTAQTPSDLAKAWAQVRQAASRGLLVPFGQWRANDIPGGLLQQQPMPAFRIPREHIRTLADRHTALASKIARTLASLSRPWRARIQASDLPALEKVLWEKALAQQMKPWVSMAFGVGTPEAIRAMARLPYWAKEHLGSAPRSFVLTAAQRALGAGINELLAASGVEENDCLTGRERRILTQWVALLSDRRHPRLLASSLLEASQQSIQGVGFHQMLFAVIDRPGVPAKALAWQALLPPAVRARLCREPDASGMTLPLY